MKVNNITGFFAVILTVAAMLVSSGLYATEEMAVEGEVVTYDAVAVDADTETVIDNEEAGIGELSDEQFAKEPDADDIGELADISEMTQDDFSSLGMVTGSPTGTYYRFGNDIKNVVQGEGINILVKESRGSIDNINRIDSRENAAFGIVQSDVLGFLTRSDSPKSRRAVENLRMIFPFYQEEVHIIANRNVKEFKDLRNKTVVVGQSGSGNWLTSMNLFNITGVRPTKMLRLSPEEGLVAVLSNKADAMVYVAGKPVKLFQNLKALANHEKYAEVVAGLHIVPLTSEDVLREYSPVQITPEDYHFVKETVDTVAVTAVLVSYNFSAASGPYAESRCDAVTTFSDAIRSNIDLLRESGHPKWLEVDLNAEVGIWQRDPCSIPKTTVTTETELEQELLEVLTRGE